MSVLGAVQQADRVAGDVVVSTAASMRAVDERAGSAVERAFGALPQPVIVPKIERAGRLSGTAVDIGIEVYARAMLFALAWSMALVFWPIVPIAPVLAGLLTLYLYGL